MFCASNEQIERETWSVALDTITILLDRIGNTDDFSRSWGGGGGGVYVSVVVSWENKVQGSEGGGWGKKRIEEGINQFKGLSSDAS